MKTFLLNTWNHPHLVRPQLYVKHATFKNLALPLGKLLGRRETCGCVTFLKREVTINPECIRLMQIREQELNEA